MGTHLKLCSHSLLGTTYLYNLVMCRPLIIYSMNYSRSNSRYGLKYNGFTSSLGGKDMGIGGLEYHNHRI